MEKIKSILKVVLDFTTGLGFYGLGLLIAGASVWALLGMKIIGAGLIGAFIFKNYKSIVDYVKELIKRKEV